MSAAPAINFSWDRTSRETADVCLIVEGCYPFVPGGVSGWIDWLIRTQPELKFSVVSLWPSPTGTQPRYAMPDNAISFETIYLQDFGAPTRRREMIPAGLDALSRALDQFMRHGGVDALAAVVRTRAQLSPMLSFGRLLNGPAAWDIVHGMYDARMPHGSFLHYFWAWRALLGGLFATLEAPLPKARVYHTISTGYAGVLAARAARDTGRPDAAHRARHLHQRAAHRAADGRLGRRHPRQGTQSRRRPHGPARSVDRGLRGLCAHLL